MNILSAIFPKTKKITSETIAAEIDRSTKERNGIQKQLADVHADLALMSDDDHRLADDRAAAMRRSVARLDAKIAELEKARDDAIIAEAEVERLAALDRLRARAETARKAVNVESKTLLEQYDSLSEQIATIVEKIGTIDSEAASVNEALRKNRVAEDVPSVTQTWRKAPDKQASETKEMRPCWVYYFPGSPPDTGKTKFQYEAPREEVVEATIGSDGKPVPTAPAIHNYYGRELVITPRLENREITTGRQFFRPGHVEAPLSGIHLPAGFSGGKAHWPRSS